MAKVLKGLELVKKKKKDGTTSVIFKSLNL